ncbi:electron transfer flavoprotein subunit alpha/FixB family protein [Vogesella sp. GCM10023246]|uniref:Electron transfer flavoprotein subunit alpha/FixB family protein n=1 Tax=Vogesella oryzagri TaxID=3160864 RepID=A0ABV1M3Y4_9NEIS
MFNDRAIPRIDPRRPYVIGPSGLKRIVLGEEVGSRELQQNAHGHSSVKPQRSQGPFRLRSLVVLHTDRGALDEAARETLAAAAILASPDTEVVALLFGGNADSVAAAGEAGADRVLLCADPGFAPQRKLAVLAELWQREAPSRLCLPDRGADADLGRRFASRQGLAVACDVIEVVPGREVRSLAPAGQFAVQPLPPVLLLARKAADARLPFRGQGNDGGVLALPDVGERIRDLGTRSCPASQLALEEADLIVSAGNGVQDTGGLRQLAERMGAAVGASRVAVDDGRFAREQQVGATGKTVQASAYLAFGISGAVQHLQGIKECRHVIAVNLDAAAPIVKRADLTLVEDCQALISALNQLLAAERAANPVLETA